MSYDPSQEVRFAVVMYGGVSLAIYMNGVAQELLHAVRATANLPDAKLEGAELVYREIGQLLFWGRTQGEPADPRPSDPIETRIVVDILSGTSAGGINAVFLAKALALKSKSLDDLKQMWLSDADIGTLLNDATGGSKSSLLNSLRMYRLLVEALNKMDAQGGRDKGADPLADQIDLFVTATDLNGLAAPIELTDKWADEKIYRMMFHFQSEGDSAGDFERRFNRMLAFAARCTSSFPAAFEPMSFKSITPDGAEETDYSKFFDRYARRDEKMEVYEARQFADGGILDNKPFSYAIDAIRYRDTARPVDRKLLFVDPSPERDPSPDSADASSLREFDFVHNAVAALVSLPGYQTIRGDIERINERNRYLNRLASLRKRVSLTRASAGSSLPVTHFGKRDLNYMIQPHRFGECYAPCHHIKVFGVTDWLARLVTSVMGFNLESDEYRAIRQLIRVWREDHYVANRAQNRHLETENKLLLDFDMDYRLRRLRHLREEIDDRLKRRGNQEGLRKALEKCRRLIQGQLTYLFKHSLELESPTRSPIAGALKNPAYPIDGNHLLEIVAPPPEEDQLKRAAEQYETLKPMFEDAAKALAADLSKTFTQVSTLALRALDADNYAEFGAEAQSVIGTLLDEYNTFDRYDCLVLPFLSGTGIEEMGEVGIFRVSPADAALGAGTDGHPERKLAGVKLGHFGAFLSRRWRANDIMWGRLDGAERIIAALLPDGGDEDLRKRLIHRAHAAILKEELTPEALFAWLAQYVKDKVGPAASERKLRAEVMSLFSKPEPDAPTLILRELIGEGRDDQYERFVTEYYKVPSGPEPEEVLRWTGRAAAIAGDMFRGLKDNGSAVATVASKLKLAGTLLTQSIRFAVPNSLGDILMRYWLLLLMLASVILIVFGPFKSAEVATVGWTALGITAALFLGKQALRSYLSGRPWWKGALTLLGAGIAVLVCGVFGIGVLTIGRWIAGNKDWFVNLPHKLLSLL